MPSIIVVTGLPCTGKTTLSRWLACQLHFPLIHKDGIKEILFDTLGWGDVDWSKRLSGASVELFFHIAEAVLVGGSSLILESNFDPQLALPRFRQLEECSGTGIIQVCCTASIETILQRFQARSGSRHPGHGDDLYLQEFKTRVKQNRPMAMEIGTLIEVDTTDFQQVAYEHILELVKAHL